MQNDLILLRPGPDHLPGYIDALSRGWSPQTTRPEAAGEELEAINADASAVLATFNDPQAKGPPIKLNDGSTVKRIPGIRRIIWDGAFCGIISLRWQNGTTKLPPHCLGHIGYSVVPWKQRRGYATRALAQILPEARKLGLPFVEISTDTNNKPSQKIITACGGKLIHEFTLPECHADGTGLLYQIDLKPT